MRTDGNMDYGNRWGHGLWEQTVTCGCGNRWRYITNLGRPEQENLNRDLENMTYMSSNHWNMGTNTEHVRTIGMYRLREQENTQEHSTGIW